MSLINLHEFTHHLINHHQLSFMLDKRRKLLSSKKKRKKKKPFIGQPDAGNSWKQGPTRR